MKNGVRMMAAVALLAAAGLAQAAEEGWSFKLTPYLWAMGIDGDVGIGPVSMPVEVKFTDAVEDPGGLLSAEARYGAWGILADVAYLKLSEEVDTLVGEFGAELDQWMLQGSVVYSVVDTGSTALDLGAGARYLSLDTTLNTPLDTADLNASEGIADPILVARLRQQITENFYGVLYGDIGGFGVAADLTWQAMAAAGYSLTEWCSVLAGHRALGYEYEKDEFSLDVVENGIVIGLQFAL
jgi:hypothetical protein